MKKKIICIIISSFLFHYNCIASDTRKSSFELDFMEAELGDVFAQNNLGQRYYLGNGVEKNYIEAFKWLMKAAEKGHAHSQKTLGYMFEHGLGVQTNYKEAIKFYRSAADQGYAKAQFNLGLMFRRGRGEPKDYTKSVYWFKKAAALGDDRGQCHLAEMYETGRGGLPKDYFQALYYYELAQKQGNKRAEAGSKALLEKISSLESTTVVKEPECGICLTEKPNRAFECGHISCDKCASKCKICHICRKPIGKLLTIYIN